MSDGVTTPREKASDIWTGCCTLLGQRSLMIHCEKTECRDLYEGNKETRGDISDSVATNFQTVVKNLFTLGGSGGLGWEEGCFPSSSPPQTSLRFGGVVPFPPPPPHAGKSLGGWGCPPPSPLPSPGGEQTQTHRRHRRHPGADDRCSAVEALNLKPSKQETDTDLLVELDKNICPLQGSPVVLQLTSCI